MMDAKTQAEAGRRLERALEQCGLAVEHASSADGINLTSWESVPGTVIIGTLVRATGWKVSVVAKRDGKVVGRIE